MSSTASASASVPLRIATRGSALALAQAHLVLARCRAAFPGRAFELRILKTTGDKLQKASMARPSPSLPKGLFTKELEAALLRGEADFAVHSLKDLPTAMPEGLRLAGVLEREDARDVLVLRAALPGAAGPEDPTAAGVARRRGGRDQQHPAGAQLRALRPDLRLVEIRGNVPTRLQKLAGDTTLDATILAAAGLARLGIRANAKGHLVCPPELAAADWKRPLPALFLSLDDMLPAVGQAAIGLQCRVGDRRTAAVCRRLDDRTTRVCVEAERAFLAGFGGGCHSPVAALATVRGEKLTLQARAYDGDRSWSAARSAPVARARAVGRGLGQVARRALGVI